jgi:hypothetical protein
MLRAGRAQLLGIVIGCALTAFSLRVARAEPARMQLSIAAEPEESAALELVVRELMQRLLVEVVLDPSGDGYVARCTIDMRDPKEAVLYVHDPARDRLLVRRVARAPGSEELVREQLGHMMLVAVEALLAGATVGQPSIEVIGRPLRPFESALDHAREPPPAKEPAPDPPPPVQAEPEHGQAEPREPRPTWALRGALLYEVAALGHEPGVAHGPALALAVGSPLPLALGGLVSAQYRFPLEVEPDPVGMSTQTVALRALATIESFVHRRLAFRLGLGGGADIARLTPELAASADVRATEARTLTLAVARALAGIDWRVTRMLSLWVALAADIDLDRSQYVLLGEDGQETTVAEPWRVRPALMIGAALP